VTITWATDGVEGGPSIVAEQKILDAFNAANPDIHVNMELIDFASYDTKMVTELRGGQGADVFRVNHPNVQAWSGAGFLADLGPLTTGFDTSDFVPGLMAIGNVHGTQYTMPIDTDCRAFWYNPKLLVQAGIVDASGQAKPPSTWDELVADVAKFKGTDVYGYGYLTNSDYAMAYETVGPYLKTAGGSILSSANPPQAIASTDPNTVAAVTLLQQIQNTGATPPGEANMSDATIYNLFANSQLAMMVAGPWARDSILGTSPNFVYGTDYSVTTIPTQQAGGTSGSASGGWQIGINAKSAHLDAAAKFLQFFEDPANLMTLTSNNSFPPLIDGLSKPPFSTDPFFSAFEQLLPNSGLPIPPVPQLAQVAAQFETAGIAAVVNGQDVTAALTSFDTTVNQQVLQ